MRLISCGAKAETMVWKDEESLPKRGDNKMENMHVSDAVITTLFATSEHGLLKQDENTLTADMGALLGLRVPICILLELLIVEESRPLVLSQELCVILQDLNQLTMKSSGLYLIFRSI